MKEQRLVNLTLLHFPLPVFLIYLKLEDDDLVVIK